MGRIAGSIPAGPIKMKITRKELAGKPTKSSTGELIYELIGLSKNLGSATKFSLGHVIIPPGKSSELHYHPKETETDEVYYILKGSARMVINKENYMLSPGDVVYIEPEEQHQIFNDKGEESLEFLVICGPSWNPYNTVFVDK